MGSSTRLQDYLNQYFSKMNQMRWQEYIMGVTFIFILVCFKEGQRFWKPLRHIRSLGALFVSVCGICAVYIGMGMLVCILRCFVLSLYVVEWRSNGSHSLQARSTRQSRR